MSTKAIREAIRRLEEATEEAQPDALAEVEAIERAAKVVADCGIYVSGCETDLASDGHPEVDTAEGLFCAIAEQD